MRGDSWDTYRQVVFRLIDSVAADGTFAILTADNPEGKVRDPETNRRCEVMLLRELQSLSRPMRMQGCSPDLAHRENSFAVAIGKAQALELAASYRQNAIYWVAEGRLYLVPCLLQGRDQEHLGLFANRIIEQRSGVLSA